MFELKIAGYISMPSSEEMSSNNPSPVPKENPAAGSYSVVGLVGKSPMRCKSEEESLAKAKIESESRPTTNAYVSLVSLEQKSKVLFSFSYNIRANLYT